MATPSHVDLSVLWVPIMPETSKLGDAMEKVGQDATESFGKGSSGLGDKVHESFTKATGKVKDVFHKAGNDASESIADGVKQSSKKVEDALEDSGKKAGGKFGDAVKNMLPDSLSQGGSLLDNVAENLGRTIGAKLGSGIGDQLEKIDGYAKTVGIDISGWTGPIKDAAGPFSTLKEDGAKFASQITDVSSTFEGMPGKVGKLASAISELAIPIGMVEQGLEKINDLFDKAGGQRKWNDVVHPPGQPDGFWDQAGRLFQSWVPSGTNDNGPSAPATPPGGFWGYGASSPGNLAPFFPGIPGAPPPAHGDRQLPQGGWFGGGGHPASRHIGSDQGLTPTSKSVKQVVADMFPQVSDIGGWRPPDGFNEHSSGQALDVMIPNPSSPQGKALGDQISKYVLAHAKELGVDYTIWQQAQHNPDGSSSGMADRGSPTQNHMDHVHIHTVRGGGTGGGIAPPSDALSSGGGGLGSFGGGLGGPAGTPDNPIFVALAGGGGPGGGSPGSGGMGGSMGGGGPQMPDFLGGAMQGLGLDGSVFHTFGGSSNPMQFGAVKMGTSLLNMFGGMLGGGGAGTHPLDHAAAGLPLADMGARHAGLPGISPTSPGTRNQPSGQFMGGSGGGGGGMAAGMGGGMAGGINAAISGAIGAAGALFSDLNPGVGAPDSANGQYHLLPNPTVNHPNPGAGAAGQGESVTHNHNYYGNVGPQLNVQQSNVKSPTEDLHAAANGAGNRLSSMGGVANSGSLPA